MESIMIINDLRTSHPEIGVLKSRGLFSVQNYIANAGKTYFER